MFPGYFDSLVGFQMQMHTIHLPQWTVIPLPIKSFTSLAPSLVTATAAGFDGPHPPSTHSLYLLCEVCELTSCVETPDI